MGGAVAVDFAAFGTLMDDNKALFGIGFGADRLHLPLAFAGAVTGVDVHMKRPEAEGTVIARGIAKGFYGLSAVLASKTAVVFGESFLLHGMVLFPFRVLWGVDGNLRKFCRARKRDCVL